MSKYVTKASGVKERFDVKKVANTLQLAGAGDECIARVVKTINKQQELKTTEQVYEVSMTFLRKHYPVVAARYSLKRSLMLLGPAGYPFELFIGEVFRKQGYEVETNLMAEGWCVNHELDVVAVKDEKHFMVECKFHGRSGLKTSVKTVLYIKARFDDVAKQWENDADHGHAFHQAWIVSNTKFTSEAIKYANCIDINLLGWTYPNKRPLPMIIHELGIYPITTLYMLGEKYKRLLLKNGAVLCRDVLQHEQLLKKAGIPASKLTKVLDYAKAICEG